MHGSRRAFITAGAAALALAVMAVPDRALAFAGADILSDRISITISTPTGRCFVGSFASMTEVTHTIESLQHKADVLGVVIDLSQGHAPERSAFVDGSSFLGAEQLRLFYRDQVYAPKHAAMQPDNGAGQVSGDRAQAVGKPGDLKAGKPGGVNSGGGGTPGAKAIDARKQSWYGRTRAYWLPPVGS